MIKSVFAASLIAASTILVPSAAQSASVLDKVAETGTLTIGHRESATPFSYYDDQQNVIGYTMDICAKIIDVIKQEVNQPDLNVRLVPVTSATRIPLMANGTIDLECGSTTNTPERQEQVGFSVTTYIAANRLLYGKENDFTSLESLRGRTVVSTAGTTSIELLTRLNNEQNLGIRIVPAQDHAQGFLMLETNRVDAFFMDDGTLASLAAMSRTADKWVLSSKAYSVEPYGLMIPRGDERMKTLVDGVLTGIYQSGEIVPIYEKWFLSPIPPRNINLNIPLSQELERVFAEPTDSGDPEDYVIQAE